MRDEDRADMLARAIEEMVRGDLPENLGDEELEELLQIARIRLDAARMASQTGAETQDAVLERLIARMHVLRGEHNSGGTDPSIVDSAGDFAPDDDDPENVGVRVLQDVISMRHRAAEEAAGIAEQHREAVWQRVQARIGAHQAEKRGLLRWPFQRRDREAEYFGAALDRMILGEPIWEAEDSRLQELLRVARLRCASSMAETASLTDQSARVWSRLRPRLMARLMVARRPDVFQRRAPVPWQKLAAAGAVVAVAIAALGPIPATGLAHHPAAEFARFVGGHIGVSETSAPPNVPPVTEVIEGADLTAKEASALVGVPVHKSTFVPSGYHEASARYFPKPITADQGGVYILIYENSLASGSTSDILVFQERASDTSITVEQGFAQDIMLFRTGSSATYVSGTWRPLDGKLTWGEPGAQTLVFDLGGLRTIIQSSATDISLTDLVAIADSLAAQAIPN
ncbi:MAG: hypothetical protein Q8Q00_11185 [Dehalococcoidia bacterium]|nr:hypothetical protein [Dehalococcoidia bacterium]